MSYCSVCGNPDNYGDNPLEMDNYVPDECGTRGTITTHVIPKLDYQISSATINGENHWKELLKPTAYPTSDEEIETYMGRLSKALRLHTYDLSIEHLSDEDEPQSEVQKKFKMDRWKKSNPVFRHEHVYEKNIEAWFEMIRYVLKNNLRSKMYGDEIGWSTQDWRLSDKDREEEVEQN